MGSRSAPALVPVVLLLAGVRLGLELARPSIPLALLLAAFGLGLGSRYGVGLACIAMGLVAVWAEEAGASRAQPSWLDLDRPVVVTLRRTGPWQSDGTGNWARASSRTVRQGGLVAVWSEDLTLSVGGTGRPADETGLRVRGYLKQSIPAANSLTPRERAWRLTVKSLRFLEPEPRAAAGWFSRSATSVRSRVSSALNGLATNGSGAGPGLALARALVLGERDTVPQRWLRGLRRTGLSHLLAISGLHVALVAALLMMPGAWLPRRGRLAIVALSIPLYLVLVGLRPSLVRASIMALLAWQGFWVGRAAAGANSLACAAGVMVLLEPRLVMDLGFRLSLSATAGILVLGCRLEERWQGQPERLRRPLAAAIGAQIATLPWTAPVFGMVAPLAPLWNLAAIPWTALCLAVSLGVTGAALIAPGLAVPLLSLLDEMARLFALPGWLGAGSWRPGLVEVSLPSALAAAGLLGWLCLGRSRVRWLAMPLLILLLRSPNQVDDVSVTMIDVGQGDAFLLRDRGKSLLVDGGGWTRGDLASRILVPVLASRGVRRLTAVAMTHPDRDHCAGLVDLASYVEIGEVWMAPGWRGSDCVLDLLRIPGVAYRFLWTGEAARIGRWSFVAVHPGAGDRIDGNDRSLVILAEVRGTRILLTGDVEAAGELALLARDGSSLGPLDILKVAHHGSASSTTPRLLEETRPRLALVSAGPGNRYGHPSPVVLRRLSERGIPVLRTDRDGLIAIGLPGEGRLAISAPASPR